MSQFTARTFAEPDHVVVSLAGECDMAGRDELEAILLTAVESADVVRIDLAEVTFLDSSGIHSLVIAHHAAKRTGGQLYVTNAEGAVARVLDITGVGGLLSPPSRTDADHG